MTKLALAAAASLLILFAEVAHSQSASDLQAFKAKALARFATSQLEVGEGLLAVRLALEATATPDLTPEARQAAFDSLARSVSETSEFASLGKDAFGLAELFQVFGTFLPGGRYYVAVARGRSADGERSLILLVDARTGAILDRREAQVGPISEIVTNRRGNSFILVDDAGVIELVHLTRSGLAATSSTHEFGMAQNAGSVGWPRHFLSEDAATIYRIGIAGGISSLAVATGLISGPPDDPTEVGPSKVFARPRSSAVLSAALDGKLAQVRDIRRIADDRSLAAANRRLSRNQVFDAETGAVVPVALPESIGRRASRFAVHSDGRLVLAAVAGSEPSRLVLMDLEDRAFMRPFPDADFEETPVSFASSRQHWLTATATEIRTRDAVTGEIIGSYRYSDGAGRFPDFELGYSQGVMAITEEDRIRFLRLFFEERPHSAAVSSDNGQIVRAHHAYPQDYISISAPGGEPLVTPIVDLDIARVLTGPGEVIAAIDTGGGFHYWPDGLGGRRIDPDIPPVEAEQYSIFDRPYYFGPGFLAIGGSGEACGLWSLDDWHRISGFAQEGCYAEGFVFDAIRQRLAVLGGLDGNVSVHDVRTGAALAHFRKSEKLTDTTDLSPQNAWFSTDGRKLHIVGVRGWQVELDIETSALEWGPDIPRDTYAALGKDGKAIATRIFDDTGSGLLISGVADALRPREGWQFGAIALSPDERRLAVALLPDDYGDPGLAVYSINEGRHLFTYSLPFFRNANGISAVFSPDGQWVTAWRRPGDARTFPASEQGLRDETMSRFGPLTPTQACAWFLCN